MLLRMAMIVGVFVAGMQAVYAQDTVLSNPTAVSAPAAESANVLDPSTDYLYDVLSGEGYIGTSIALWKFHTEERPLGSLRGGYAVDYKYYLAARPNVENLVDVYVLPRTPQLMRNVLNAGPLEIGWKALRKYGHLDIYTGYNADRHEEDIKKKSFMLGATTGIEYHF